MHRRGERWMERREEVKGKDKGENGRKGEAECKDGRIRRSRTEVGESTKMKKEKTERLKLEFLQPLASFQHPCHSLHLILPSASPHVSVLRAVSTPNPLRPLSSSSFILLSPKCPNQCLSSLLTLFSTPPWEDVNSMHQWTLTPEPLDHRDTVGTDRHKHTQASYFVLHSFV